MGIVTGERVRLTHDFVSATGQRLPANSMGAAKRYEAAARQGPEGGESDGWYVVFDDDAGEHWCPSIYLASVAAP